MEGLLRLKIEKDINVEEFISFLEFHQFQHEIEEEEVLNIETMTNEKNTLVLVDESKLEEFKVLVLVYKDLLANKDQRHLNIPIENSLIDYEKTRKINTVELVGDKKPSGDEIFSKANQGEAPSEKEMEDSFYGYKKKKKDQSKTEMLSDVLNKEDFEKKSNSKSLAGNIAKEIFKIIGLIIITGLLALIFILIR